MTAEHAHELMICAETDTLQFTGIKLLEINADADIDHRIAILRDGIATLNKAK
jgi:uncharacterized small protein (DUF1192 family)